MVNSIPSGKNRGKVRRTAVGELSPIFGDGLIGQAAAVAG
jgi:hypothetical protein